MNSKVLVDYRVFTALRTLAVEDYDAGRIPVSRTADLLGVDCDKVNQAANVVRRAQGNIARERSRLVTNGGRWIKDNEDFEGLRDFIRRAVALARKEYDADGFEAFLTSGEAGIGWIGAQRAALRRLANAAESYRAEQSDADDPRCGLVQPITVAEGEELNAALDAAWVVLEEDEDNG